MKVRGWVWKSLLGFSVVFGLAYPITVPMAFVLIDASLVNPIRKIWYQRKFDKLVQERGSVDAALGDPPFRRHFDRSLKLDELAAVINFPDAASCRTGNGATARIAWEKFRVIADAEVCMFRVLNRGVPLPQSVSWLETQGLRVLRQEGRVNVIRQTYRPPVIYSISAGWGPEGALFLDRRVFAWFNPVFRPYGQSFQIFTDATGTRIVDVHLSYDYL